MKKIFDIFRVRREERWMALVILFLLVMTNTLVICHYYHLLTPLQRFYWPLFIHNFHISGFDPITYSVVSDWTAGYNVYRHPLLAFYMYVPYLLNQALMHLTGINCAIFIMAVIQIFCAFYSAIFIDRIFREIIGLSIATAHLLTFFYFSFAFVLLSAMVPDHFILSMMLLLLALYISGRRMKNHHKLKTWQGVLYFVLTAGTSLNNGLKIFMSGLFVNGKSFFRPHYLLVAVILPAVLLWGFCRLEYRTLVWPAETARHAAKVKKDAERKKHAATLQLALAHKTDSLRRQGIITDTAKTAKAAVASKPAKPGKPAPKMGAPLMQGEFMRWTDVSTSRVQSVVENLFGESIQLHTDYLLQDEMQHRPMIVHYRHAWNYIIEAFIALLFLTGIWCGRRSRFLWLCLSYFALDMLLHVVLGFGINEVYIMSAHWIYVIPIAIAYLLKTLQRRPQRALSAAVMLLTLYLYAYNIFLIGKYLIG